MLVIFHAFAQNRPPGGPICTKFGFGLAVAYLWVWQMFWWSVKGSRICGGRKSVLPVDSQSSLILCCLY